MPSTSRRRRSVSTLASPSSLLLWLVYACTIVAVRSHSITTNQTDTSPVLSHGSLGAVVSTNADDHLPSHRWKRATTSEQEEDDDDDEAQDEATTEEDDVSEVSKSSFIEKSSTKPRTTSKGPFKRPSSIPINSTMPSVEDLKTSASSIALFWDAALKGLTSATEARVEALLASSDYYRQDGQVLGIPGTGITSKLEAKALQQHLDCMTSQGEWVYDPLGKARSSSAPNPNLGLTVHKQEGIYASCDKKFYGKRSKDSIAEWDVRESLKWKWQPSKACATTAPSIARPGLSRRRFCQYLSHKSTILLGDTPHYSLHDLLLDWTTTTPASCYGDLYCKEHSLCGDILSAKPGAGIENWQEDEKVWLNLPLAPSISISTRTKSALTEESEGFAKLDDDEPTETKQPIDALDTTVIAENGKLRSASVGTLLRYRRTDGLKTSTKFVRPTYENDATGVREMNQQWIADARRADIVVMNKAPLPFPLAGHNATFDEWFNDVEDPKDVEEVAEKYIEAAWKITEDVWLPELMDTIKLVRGSLSPADLLIIYRGGWRSHHDCGRSGLDEDDLSTNWEWQSPGDGPPPHLQQPTLSQLIFSNEARTKLIDQHTLWFNLQTIFQNFIVRKFIAPKFGIPFLDMESSMSVWRSGMIGGSASHPFESLDSRRTKAIVGGGLVDQSGGKTLVQNKNLGLNPGMRTAASGDCSRYCIASPGSGIEEAFIGGLTRIFERGFASTEARKQTWTGDGFKNIKERIADRETKRKGVPMVVVVGGPEEPSVQ